MLSVGDMFREHYSITQKVAAGDFGDVYQALDIRTREKVAIKEFYPKDISGKELQKTVENFHHEINYLKSLNHPGIVKFYEDFTVKGAYYYVTRWVEGKSLGQILGENKKLFEGRKIISLFYFLLDLVTFFHKQKIPYTLRLLRPSDIIIDDNGRPTIIDLGTAMDFMPLNMPDGYAVPEEPADSTRDVYHVGSLVYELLTNVKPGSAPTGSLPQIYKINKHVPKSLSDIVMKCIAIRRERFRYISGVKTDLLRWFPEFNNSTNITGGIPLEEEMIEKQTQFIAGNFTCLGLLLIIALLVVLGFQHKTELSMIMNRIWNGEYFPFNVL
jgi:serine/threonine protein kinase, bacterial